MSRRSHPIVAVRIRPVRIAIMALGLAGIAAGAWWMTRGSVAAPPRVPPNVLIVTIDTLRADRVGAYGYAAARTPALDRLAAEGVRCANAVAAAPITMPSHASLFTGLYPPAHGVRDNGTAALPDDVVTLAERLTGAGYTSHAFVSAVVLSRLYGLDAGFASYDDDLWAEDAPRLFMIRERPARHTADRFLEWFAQWQASPADGARASGEQARAASARAGQARAGQARAPFFAWVHFFDPHQPLEAAAEDRQGAASPYDAEVTGADRAVGRVIDALRNARTPAPDGTSSDGSSPGGPSPGGPSPGGSVLDNTIVILTSDHGESLGEHGEETHAVFVYDATVRVPLIVRYPASLPTGRVYDGPVRHIDVVPTLLAMLGLPADAKQPDATSRSPAMQGVDLSAAWQGTAPAPVLAQYSESLLSELGFGMAPLHAIRKDGYKWIRAPRPELYDLGADPHERSNLYTARTPRTDAIAAALDRELEPLIRATRTEDARGGAHAASRDTPMARETVEMLQSLGYLAPGAERRSMGGIDPKDGIHVYRQLEEARHEAQQRRWPRAEAIVRTILATRPNHVSARNVLGLALVRQRKYAEARDAYLQSLAAEPDQFRIHANLGSLALLQRDLGAAAQGFTRALEMNPRFAEAMLNLGLIASLRGDAADAEAWYRKADAIDPGSPATARRFGDLYYEDGQYRQALAAYDRALQRAPRLFPALVQAGNSARRVGDRARAAASFERAAAVRPDSWIPWYNLACLRAAGGDRDGAFTALRESLGRGLRDPALLDDDPDLAALRSDPRFAAMVGRRSHAPRP